MKLIPVGLVFVLMVASSVFAHDAEVTYLGNEGVMVTNGSTKVLFDPFFHNDYGIYTLVPEDIRQKIFSGDAPYDNIAAIFISHAHGDHFSKTDVIDFLIHHEETKLIAPQQAIDQILSVSRGQLLKDRLSGIKLNYHDPPVNLSIGSISIEAVRIPHAGWPRRAEVENIVFRVSLGDDFQVMHMGDADPDDAHFSPYEEFWDKESTELALPPYWFMLYETGIEILDKRLKIKRAIGLHVPEKVPDELIRSGREYFSQPGEVRKIAKD